MTKIEEVARAIYEKSPLYGAKANIGDAMRPLTWDEAARYGHEDYFDMARAAIEAMRARPKKELEEAKTFVIANLPATFRELQARNSNGLSASKIDAAIKSLQKSGVIAFTKKGRESVWQRADAALAEPQP